MEHDRKLFIRKTFVHRDGRRVLAYEDTEAGQWFVEARPADFRESRPRWYRQTELQAAAVVFALLGDEEGWQQETPWD